MRHSLPAGSCRTGKVLFFALIMAVLSSCARPGSPSGGPRDTDPPRVESSTPENGAINFSGDRISVTFNEFVELHQIQEKFMVSPLLEERPRVTMRGRTMIIDFEEEFRENTTYTLYFQDAIRDLNEGNILENYRFSFSTGDYLDSLSIAGNVYDALTLEAWESYLVMLYSNLADSAPIAEAPDYLALSGRDGYFRIDNIRPGRYRLYALGDDNNNRRYEPGSERFAFYSDTIEITPGTHYMPPPVDTDTIDTLLADTLVTDTLAVDARLMAEQEGHVADTVVPEGNGYSLYLFQQPRTRHFLTSSQRLSANVIRYTLSTDPDTTDFTFTIKGEDEVAHAVEYNASRDTITVWLLDSTHYNQPIINSVVTYPFTDTVPRTVVRRDTIPVRFSPPRGYRPVTERSVGITSDIIRTGIHPGRSITLSPDLPLRSFNSDRIKVVEATDTLLTPKPVDIVFDESLPRKLVILQSLPEETDYLLILDSAAVESLYGTFNDSLALPFRVRPAGAYGSLRVNLDGYSGSVVVQLLNRSEDLIQEKRLTSPGNVTFSFLDEAMYRLRVIYDTDGNGKFTPGNFLKGLEPEKVSYFPTELDVKSNWDLIEDWDISVKRYKSIILRSQRPLRR